MATVTKPIALDESLNTTEATPRNIADVLAEGIGDLIHAVSQIAPQTVYDLDDLGDVDITSPSNGQVLKYNGTSQKWENGAGGGSGDSVSWSQIQQSGTKIAEIEINGVTTDVYAPTGGGFSALLVITAGTGLTVTASKGGDTYTATEISTGTYEVSVDSAGTWTVSDGSNTATVAVSASTTYYVTLSSVPDGRTVLPTDDVSIWLACGGRSEAYTTLAEVLNDSVCLSALISDSNAVDYLVRSKSFIGNEALIPVMTSNTTPSGVCSGSSKWTSTDYYRAFEGDDLYGWVPYKDYTNNYVSYQFPSNVKFSKCDVVVRRQQNTAARTLKLQYGDSWTDIDTISVPAQSSTTDTYTTFSLSFNEIETDKIRIFCADTLYSNSILIGINTIQLYTEGLTSNSNAMSYIGLNNYASNTLLADSTWCSVICNSAYFESVLNVKVPVMTSNNTPSGVCFGVTPATGNEAYKAFDGDDSTEFISNAGSTSGDIGYTFPSKAKIYMCKMLTNTNSEYSPTYTYKLQSSDDNFTTINDITDEFTVEYNANRTPVSTTKIFDSAVENLSFRLFKVTTSYRIRVNELQFYGRADI